jgi:hypothetical protein
MILFWMLWSVLGAGDLRTFFFFFFKSDLVLKWRQVGFMLSLQYKYKNEAVQFEELFYTGLG